MANLHRWQPSSRRNHCSLKITSPFSTPSTHLGLRTSAAYRACEGIHFDAIGPSWNNRRLDEKTRIHHFAWRGCDGGNAIQAALSNVNSRDRVFAGDLG